MSADDTRRMNIFEGNVVLTKGTILVRAERIVVRRMPRVINPRPPPATRCVSGKRQDPKEGKDGRLGRRRGPAHRDRRPRQQDRAVENARVNRDGDEVAGNYILVDQRSDFFSSAPARGRAAGACAR